jgi:acetolactate synthase regulatory subunit
MSLIISSESMPRLTRRARQELGLQQSTPLAEIKQGVYLVNRLGKTTILKATTSELSQKNRRIEVQVAWWAGVHELGPTIFSKDHKSNWMVTEFLPFVDGGKITISKIAHHLTLVHSQNIPLDLIHKTRSTTLERLITQLDKAIDCSSCENLKTQATLIEEKLANNRVLCHLNVTAKKISHPNDQHRFLDWTKAGSDHPFMDLAFVAMNFKLSTEEQGVLLKEYLKGDISLEDQKTWELVRKVPYLIEAAKQLNYSK